MASGKTAAISAWSSPLLRASSRGSGGSVVVMAPSSVAQLRQGDGVDDVRRGGDRRGGVEAVEVDGLVSREAVDAHLALAARRRAAAGPAVGAVTRLQVQGVRRAGVGHIDGEAGGARVRAGRDHADSVDAVDAVDAVSA